MSDDIKRALAEAKRKEPLDIRIHVLIIAVLLLLIGVCAAFKLVGNGPTPPKTILRLAGSNTIGETLAPSLAEAFLKEQGATDVKIIPGAKADEKIVQGTLPGEKSVSSITIAAHGSATAFTSLADGSCDIGMASRRIKPEEVAKLASLGDMCSAANEHVLGLDGIAVIVNASSHVNALSKDQIMRIFTGEVADWSQIGFSHGEIKVHARDDKSGTYDTFKTLVLAGKALAPGALRFEDSNQLSEAVASDPNAIGFVGLPFVHSAKPIAVSSGAAAWQPTRLTVARQVYPLSRQLFLYTPSNPTKKFTRAFVEFVISEHGQDVVGANGFVDQNLNVASAPSVTPAGAPEEYKQLTRNAKQLNTDFHFQTGTWELDNKSLVDLDRVVSMISSLKSTEEEIIEPEIHGRRDYVVRFY